MCRKIFVQYDRNKFKQGERINLCGTALNIQKPTRQFAERAGFSIYKNIQVPAKHSARPIAVFFVIFSL